MSKKLEELQKILNEYSFPTLFKTPVEFLQFLQDNFQGIQTRELRELGDDEVFWEFRLKGSIKVWRCIMKERFAWNRDPVLRQKSKEFK